MAKKNLLIKDWVKFSRGSGASSLIHTEGTGLGLYVARLMIEAHQGKIWAKSAGVGKVLNYALF